MSNHPTTFLDVEDDDQRQKRIGNLLERLNTTSPSSSVSLDIGHQPPPGPIEPPAELLARVQAFLPAISASNEALSQQKPEAIDIEHVAEDEAQYIEMNLGLGVFEAKPLPNPNAGSRSPSPSPSSEAESTSDTSSSESSESESDTRSYDSGSEEDSDEYTSSDSNDDSDSESGSGSSVDMKPISSRPIKPLPRRVSQQTNHEA